jgi:hypothetical protein
MEYMTAQQAAEKWGITKRRVQILCSEDRIHGAKRIGHMWVLPIDAVKPEDKRLSKNKCIKDLKIEK